MNAVERKVWIESIMARLRNHYAEQTPLPLRGTATVQPEVMERTGTLSLKMLQRLYRYVMSEGYGE